MAIGVLTSGGDAPGMNAAVRAVLRAGLDRGQDVYLIQDGYLGLVEGGDRIQAGTWRAAACIIQMGGTEIGSARSEDFLKREGRLRAAENLIQNGIDSLVVIGGDGSLTGACVFHEEWPGLVEELHRKGKINVDQTVAHRHLQVIGLPASIDNDLFGTDISIGADTALHRIVEAVDALSSTAAAHQRTFVVEVMGRRCGYLALMAGLATGADWLLIPEDPPVAGAWKDEVCRVVDAGIQAGKRGSIAIIAEGAQTQSRKSITAADVQKALEDELKLQVRVTVLGHVQRGGSPSVFDRNLGTLFGFSAVEEILKAQPGDPPVLVGLRGNRVNFSDLNACMKRTKSVNEALDNRNFSQAMRLRGAGFQQALDTFRTLVLHQTETPVTSETSSFRLAVVNAGGPAPGMNTAVRAAVRLGIDKGIAMLGVKGGFDGMIEGKINQLDWMSVNGWASKGGSELGTSRTVPRSTKDFKAIAQKIDDWNINGLLIIGGWTAYESALALAKRSATMSSLRIPIVCVPASIDNNLPGAELSIGADTALNNIVGALDKIKQSGIARKRCFVVEVMGRYCGYLALMSGLASGAETVYLHEHGVSLKDLELDIERLHAGFRLGKRVGLVIRNERASRNYTTELIAKLLEDESQGVYDVRQAVLGHLQQGGRPSPFDRIKATELAVLAVEALHEDLQERRVATRCIGLRDGEICLTDLQDAVRAMDRTNLRSKKPKDVWWMETMWPIHEVLAKPGPDS